MLKKGFDFIAVWIAVLSAAMLSYGADSKTFPVGALFPMTGPQAYYGRVMSRGAQLAADHLNADRGAEGYLFKLGIADFQNIDEKLALTGLQKMMITKNIPFLLTSFSAVTLAVQPVCEKADILMINGGAYSPKILNKPYLYTLRVSQNQMVPAMLRYLWEKNVRKLSLIYMQDFGESVIRELLIPLWTKMGGSIVSDESHPPGITDFSAYIARIKAAAPDAVYDISTGQDQAYLVRQAREAGITLPFSVVDWNDTFQTIAGKASENIYFLADDFDTAGSDPLTRRFVMDYEEKWKELPDFYAANYYDAVYNILGELVKRAVKAGGNPLNGGELEKAIRTDPVFKTVYGGNLTLNKDGSSKKVMAVFKIADGKKIAEKRVDPE